MKHLPKHLQPRWRYLAVTVEAWPDAEIGRDAFQRHLWFSAQNLIGETGSAELDLSVVRYRFSGGSGEAIVRVRRGTTDRARAVVACLDEINGHPIGTRIAGTSGTIRACEEKYMGHGREQPDQRYVAFGGTSAPGYLRSSRVDVERDGTFVGATILDLE